MSSGFYWVCSGALVSSATITQTLTDNVPPSLTLKRNATPKAKNLMLVRHSNILNGSNNERFQWCCNKMKNIYERHRICLIVLLYIIIYVIKHDTSKIIKFEVRSSKMQQTILFLKIENLNPVFRSGHINFGMQGFESLRTFKHNIA